MTNTKIALLSQLLEIGLTTELMGVSLVFGHFNAVHPGHIRYFHTARNYGDRLVVALEGDEQLPEIERRVGFPENERAQALAELDVIDKIIILGSSPLEELVEILAPKALVLGKEFESERSFRVTRAVELVREQGGEVVFDAGETHYASANIFSGSRNQQAEERWKQFLSALKNQDIDLDKAAQKLNAIDSPRILVVGDTIVDRYIACDPIGMSSEAPVVVVKELETRDYVGGAGIVAAHLASLGGKCTFVSVVGVDEQAEFVLKELQALGISVDLIEDSSRPTTFKTRYMVENQKLFRVSRLKEHSLPTHLEDILIDRLVELAPDLDGILVSDFVYGVITPRVLEVLDELATKHEFYLFGDLQCSSQIGNVSKFKHYQLLCPTEREVRVALNNQDDGVEYVANLLLEKTQSRNLILKLGSNGLIAYARNDETGFLHRQHYPALSVNPIDVAGAGDSLLAGVAISMLQGLTLMESAALGTCIAAIAVERVGNCPVSLSELNRLINQRDVMINER